MGICSFFRRQDEIGTPFCITVDGQSVGDGSVTIRDRDTVAQDRIPAENVRAYIHDHIQAWTQEV